MNINCKCQKYNLSSKYKDDFQKYRQEILEELLKIRKYCKALKNVFLPDNKLKEYSYKMLGIFGQSEGHHESVVLRALMENSLSLITSPIHKFLLNEKAREDYRNNINDYWFLEKSFKDKEKKYHGNYGKFYELLFAEWLQNTGWEITYLEAWDKDSSDVEATSPDKQSCAFEVKTYFPNIPALEYRNRGEAYSGCGENPREIEEKYTQMIANAEEQFKAETDKKRIVAIIDMENKIEICNILYPQDTNKMLITAMKKSNELWILKIDYLKLERVFRGHNTNY